MRSSLWSHNYLPEYQQSRMDKHLRPAHDDQQRQTFHTEGLYGDRSSLRNEC
jgi:hypothetical protein